MKKVIDIIAALLLVIGGLNLGVIGLLGFDVLGDLFITLPIVVRVIYILIGLSAIYAIVYLVRHKCHH